MNTNLTCQDIEKLSAEIDGLRDENISLRAEIDKLKDKMDSSKFNLCYIADCNKVSFYTGFTSIESLDASYKFLGPAVNNLTYWNGSKSKISSGTDGYCAEEPLIEAPLHNNHRFSSGTFKSRGFLPQREAPGISSFFRKLLARFTHLPHSCINVLRSDSI